MNLDGVTVVGRTQNGGVVSASNSSSISKSIITNTYDVADGRTSAALSVGGGGEHTIAGSSFAGKSAVYVNAPRGAVAFDDCVMTGTVSGSAAINMYSGDAVNVRIANSRVAAHASGRALDTAWNMAGVVELGAGNSISGPIKVAGRDNSTNVYELKVTGGAFTASGTIPFVPQDQAFEAQMLERLNVVGGTFDVDVSSVLRSGYECVKNPDGTWGVYDDVAASGYYTLAADGSKVKHASIAEALANGEGTVFVSRNSVLSNDDAKALSSASRSLSCAPGVTLSYDGTLTQLLGYLTSAQDLALTLKTADEDMTLRGVGIAGGKLVACSAGITDKNAETFEPLLAKGHVFDASSSDYRVIATPESGALIGSHWYPDLDRAVTGASINDVTEQLCETITMLSDYDGGIAVVYPKASFVIDFAGHAINAGADSGFIVAPLNFGGSLVSSPDGCDITLKNGRIVSDGMGVGTNGTLKDVTLHLIDMEIAAGSHGMYLAANGATFIDGSSIHGDSVGIELRAGSLHVSGKSAVSGGKGEPSVAPNASGTTASNTAIAVVQHTTKHPINVVIENGSFEGGAALLQADPHGNNAGNVVLDVKGGTYVGTISSEDCTGFIKGGTFDDAGAVEYVAEGNEFVKGEDGMFGVQEVKPIVPPVVDPDGDGDHGDKPVVPPAGKPDGDSGHGHEDESVTPPAGNPDEGGQHAGVQKPQLPVTGDSSTPIMAACLAAAAIALVGGGFGFIRSRTR